MVPDDPLLSDDPALDGGEWLFRKGGQVFGPVDSRTLARMLYRGEVEGRTAISSGDGEWRPAAEVGPFVVHARKAEAALRVEAEVTGARALRRRRNRALVAGVVVVSLLVVGGAVWVAVNLARKAHGTSALLEDFGAGLRIASAARVGISRRAEAQDEYEVTFEEPATPGGPRTVRKRPRRTAPGQAARASPGAVDGGDLVAAQFDGGRIQAVVAREQRGLVPCFRAEAARSPDFRGDVPIEFVIGNDGRVAQLWIDEPRFRDGPLRDCLLRVLGGWRFEGFPGQRPTVSLAFGMGR
jgi:hypothetical protein